MWEDISVSIIRPIFMFQTIQYLQDTPCSHQSAEIIHNFLKALEPFKLTKSEKVMLLNSPPTTPLEIQLVCIHFLNWYEEFTEMSDGW
jgi:hypothetical protein